MSDSRSTPEDQWLSRKQQILSRIQSRMEQQNTANPQAIAPTVADIGKILDSVRSLTDDQFRSQKEQLVLDLMKVMSSGMGRTGVPMSATSAGKSALAGQIQWIDVHNHLIVGPRHDYAGAFKAALAVMDQIGIQKMIVMPTPRAPEMPTDPNEINELFNMVRQNSSRFAFMAGGESLNVMLQQAGQQGRVTENMKKQFEQKAIEILNRGAVGFGEIAIHHLSLNGSDHPYESGPAHR